MGGQATVIHHTHCFYCLPQNGFDHVHRKTKHLDSMMLPRVVTAGQSFRKTPFHFSNLIAYVKSTECLIVTTKLLKIVKNKLTMT